VQRHGQDKEERSKKMGIFSNKCANPDCNARVPKSAKFCNICGESASAADTNCGRCGAVVGAQSKYCWKCGCNLKEHQKTPLFSNRWIRGEDDFAIRIDEYDVKGFLIKGLIVEHGTRGMVFQQGRFCGYIDEGKYDVNGFLRKVNNFNQTTPTSVVLVDAGDVELHLEAIKLYSKDQMEVDAAFKALVQLKDPEKFFTNAFKSRNQLTIGYLAGSLTDELRSALQTYVGTHSVKELYSNTQLRQEVEGQMQLELQPILERIGLDIVQLRFIDFFCPAYDPIRQDEAKHYVDTRKVDIYIDRLKLAQRLRKEMATGKMERIKSEKDLEDFIKQTEHELGLKGIIRDDEMDKLKRQFAFDRNKELVTQQIEIEGIKNEHTRNQARLDLIDKVERDLQEAKSKDQIERLEAERDFWEAEKATELRKKSELVELEVEAQTLEQRSKASAQALISILDGPAADRIMKLEQLRAKQSLTPDQIIAITAADSPQIAQVLAEKYKAEAAINNDKFKQLQEFMAKQEQTAKDSADRLERVMNAALEQMGTTAASRAKAHSPGGQTVVTSGGMGAPVVINPQKTTGEKNCPKCKQIIPADSNFCPNCRAKV
jgi:RNA polymerase subunit RPABC4/transcription elongation factor Spt4/S-adenosylmethionine/arginine decarboxylase-like enzyme